MKKHTLAEHEKDAERWWYEHHSQTDPQQRQMLFFLAYERWTNDKPLLAEEEADDTDGQQT